MRGLLTACAAPLFLTVMCSATSVEGGLPYGSRSAGGQASVVPLVVIAVLAVCAQRLAFKVTTRTLKA